MRLISHSLPGCLPIEPKKSAVSGPKILFVAIFDLLDKTRCFLFFIFYLYEIVTV